MKVFCFFEQSGTFKNEFIKLGYQAYDCDILNNFNQTDFVIDLFGEIEKAYVGMPSIFDSITKNDLIFAFFPCVRFTKRMIFNFTRTGAGNKKFTDIEKLEQNIRYFNEMNYYYSLISKLAIICLRRDFRLIIENPYQKEHILSQFWSLKPAIIHMDRGLYGDYFKKPTQYWFINLKPSLNFDISPLVYKERNTINNIHNKVERSLISSDYAKRFIKEYVL